MKLRWLDLSFWSCIAGSLILFVFSPAYLIRDPDLRLAAAMLSAPLFFLAASVIPCVCFQGRTFLAELGLTAPSKQDILPVLSAVPVFFLSAVSTAIVRKLGSKVAPQLLAGYAVSCSGGMFLLILFCAGILAPLAEEVAFRRVMFGYFREKIPGGEIPSYLLTSLLFAVFHGLIWQSVLLFFFGLLLQWYQRNGSTTRAVLTHSLLNFCSLAALWLVRSGVLPQ